MKNTNMKGQDKVTKVITDQIIKQLDAGVIPWKKPWIGAGAAWSRSSGKPYNFINQMLLMLPGEYATFEQITKEGGKVNKGAKSRIIVEFFRKSFERKDNNGNAVLDENGDPEIVSYWKKRYCRVFNIEHDTNLAVKHEHGAVKYPGEPIEIAQALFNHYTGRENIAVTSDDLNSAFYSPAGDFINLPGYEQFKNKAEYYSTAFHEAAHSTGHKSRLDRLAKMAAFGSEDYGKEELTAEITAAAVMSTLGIDTESTFNNSAAYIDNWTKAIKGGKADIISAAGLADKAYNMIFDGFEFTPDPSPENPGPGNKPETEPEKKKTSSKAIRYTKADVKIIEQMFKNNDKHKAVILNRMVKVNGGYAAITGFYAAVINEKIVDTLTAAPDKQEIEKVQGMYNQAVAPVFEKAGYAIMSVDVNAVKSFIKENKQTRKTVKPAPYILEMNGRKVGINAIYLRDMLQLTGADTVKLPEKAIEPVMMEGPKGKAIVLPIRLAH